MNHNRASHTPFMPLTPSTRLGPYEVQSAIGAGGMGEVWRAHDRKLGRDVALKILPDGFANDPDRRARFVAQSPAHRRDLRIRRS
jgi:eukaryotic-like serine/threonine-protein kinase